jgi:hypothetical protein
MFYCLFVGDDGSVIDWLVYDIVDSGIFESESIGMIILRFLGGLPLPFPILFFLLLEVGDG